jgi:hypothetical protein
MVAEELTVVVEEGGGHLFNWLQRIDVFIPLYVFCIEKLSVWSKGAV